MSYFPITRCPYCGCSKMEIRQDISGTGSWYIDLETGDIDMSKEHEDLYYVNINEYVECARCGRELSDIKTNKIYDYLFYLSSQQNNKN